MSRHTNTPGLALRILHGVIPFGYPFLRQLGFNPLNALYGIGLYIRDALRFAYLPYPDSTLKLRLRDLWPSPYDRFATAGNIPKHYFKMDLWAAKRLFSIRPARHLDVGSRLDGFVGHCLVFTHVTVLDVRPLDAGIPNLSFFQADCRHMSQIESSSVESLSSLHALEHVGLGRYGDALDPAGHIKAAKEMARILKPGGTLLLAVPIGRERLHFNSHRVFAYDTVISMFAPLQLLEFSAIDDEDNLVLNANPEISHSWEMGCGLFAFEKTVGGIHALPIG
jgi:hypothetical protein